DYSLPHDLYCWGQDRGGTLIPLIGQFFHGALGISLIWSVSLSNYLIVVLGGLGFMQCFERRSSKVMFALLWLLPPWRFVDMLRFPFGVQYGLLGIVLLLVATSPMDGGRSFRLQDHGRMLLLMIVTILAVWVSDLAVLTIGAAGAAWLLWRRMMHLPLLPRKEIIAWCTGGALIGAAFIGYAKLNAPAVTGDYQQFNTPGELVTAISTFGRAFLDLILFRTAEPYMSAYALLAVASFIAVVWLWRKHPRSDVRTGLALFLALDAVLLVAAVLSSKWAVLNLLNRRYFIGAYIGLSIMILLLNELTTRDRKYSPWITGLLWATVLAGALSGPMQMKFIWPGTLESRVDVASEFLKLGRIGLIGEYGNAYVSSTPDPAQIASTPHNDSDVKNIDLVPPVFDGRNIYVIKDMWLDSFPDTLSQFGHVLVREGESFTIAGCTVNQYVVVK
ncbi:MAG: hypothetical protein ABIY71_06915, partial [Flavobacteriales bacterium]